MFGQPLVEPLDDIPLDGPYPPGLQSLADDFVAHGYDLQRLVRVIAATDVYQQASTADHEITAQHEQHWAAFPLTRLRPEQVSGSILQAASLKTVDADAHIFARLQFYDQQRQFVERYGDLGEDEFTDRGGTIPQRLLMMNGALVQERTKDDFFNNAATRISALAQDNRKAVEIAYLATLTRRPTAAESKHFAQRLGDAKGTYRHQIMEDVYWSLCNSASHFHRRTLLKAAGLSGLAWLTPVAHLLGRAEEKSPKGKPAKSVIMLWMQGGPSQLETWDPHPGKLIGGETRAMKTAAKDVRIASSMPATAEVMDSIAVLRVGPRRR
jgi:hypothetical protein